MTEQTNLASSSGFDDDSSLSSHGSFENSSNSHRPTFTSGLVIKSIDDTVLLEQARESLKSSLDLIEKARDSDQPWKDARDLLDATAAALDDAGLALRRQQSEYGSMTGTNISDTSAEDIFKKEKTVRDLADRVIDKRRCVLGKALLHNADGPWAKIVYGDGDGISFGEEALACVPDAEKEELALIIWSSQTGTARGFAKRLAKTLGKGKCEARNMKDLTLEDVAKCKRIYVVCSTFGCGRPPREGEIFYSMLQLAAMQYQENTDDLSECDVEKPLSGVSFAVAALGSSKFKNFAAFGKGISKELQALGAEMIMDVTTVDAKEGKAKQQASFEIWSKKIADLEKERLKVFVLPAKSNRKSGLLNGPSKKNSVAVAKETSGRDKRTVKEQSDSNNEAAKLRSYRNTEPKGSSCNCTIS